MSKRILAADDSRTVRLAIAYTFQKEPAVELLLASSGNAALDILRREPVDLLLLDYQMPDIDGTTLCARLKQEPQLAHIPILLLTGRNYDPSLTEKLGANGAIPKPFLTSELIRRAAGILSFPYTPAPLSIAEELGERRADSIEIDIDLGLDDLSAPTEASYPPAGFAPTPLTRPGPPPPPRTNTGSHTPMLMPEKELPFHGGTFAPPPAAALGGRPQDMIIDDLPYDSRANAMPAGPPLRHAPPVGRAPVSPPLPGPPTLPGLPPLPPGVASSQSALQSLPPTRPHPSGNGVEEELEVYVGKPLEVYAPPVRQDPEELVLPMEDEPSAAFPPMPPPLPAARNLPPVRGAAFPPLQAQTTPPVPSLPVAPVSPPPLPSTPKKDNGEAEALREGAYLKTNISTSTSTERGPTDLPAPTPLPPFAPKEPPKRPKGRMSPQATQKFRMLDLLDESDLTTTSNRGPRAPSVVSVKSLLPTSEVETVSSRADATETTSISSDILEIEISDVESTAVAPLPKAAAPPVTKKSFDPFGDSDKSGPFDSDKSGPFDSESSGPFEKMTGPPPVIEPLEPPTKAAPPPFAPSQTVVRTSGKDKDSSKDTSYEMPFVGTEAEEEEGSSIRVQAADFVKGPGGHPMTESSASFSIVPDVPVVPCPPGQVQLLLGAPLALREAAALLQFAEHMSRTIERRLDAPALPALFIDTQRRHETTVLAFGGELPHLLILLALFLECWPNLQGEDKESLHQALFERAPEEERPRLQRLASRMVVDAQPYIQALRQTLPLLQNTALEECTSGLSTPAALLYEDDGISSMVVEEPLQEERAGLTAALEEIMDIRSLRGLLEEAFSLDLDEIVPPGLSKSSRYLAVIYHFELRYQIPDLAEAIKEEVASFDPTPFVKYPGN